MKNKQNVSQILENLKTEINNYYIGCAIADKRQELGFSQEETAHLLNISTYEFKLYETGEKEISPEILYKLSNIFNVKVSSFFNMLNYI